MVPKVNKSVINISPSQPVLAHPVVSGFKTQLFDMNERIQSNKKNHANYIPCSFDAKKFLCCKLSVNDNNKKHSYFAIMKINNDFEIISGDIINNTGIVLGAIVYNTEPNKRCTFILRDLIVTDKVFLINLDEMEKILRSTYHFFSVSFPDMSSFNSSLKELILKLDDKLLNCEIINIPIAIAVGDDNINTGKTNKKNDSSTNNAVNGDVYQGGYSRRSNKGQRTSTPFSQETRLYATADTKVSKKEIESEDEQSNNDNPVSVTKATATVKNTRSKNSVAAVITTVGNVQLKNNKRKESNPTLKNPSVEIISCKELIHPENNSSNKPKDTTVDHAANNEFIKITEMLSNIRKDNEERTRQFQAQIDDLKIPKNIPIPASISGRKKPISVNKVQISNHQVRQSSGDCRDNDDYNDFNARHRDSKKSQRTECNSVRNRDSKRDRDLSSPEDYDNDRRRRDNRKDNAVRVRDSKRLLPQIHASHDSNSLTIILLSLEYMISTLKSASVQVSGHLALSIDTANSANFLSSSSVANF